jgi:predicted alpha/beta hydrolase
MGLDLTGRRPTRFPAQGEAWATLLMANAMAVRQEFYAPFARFLAANGVHVLTFDYAIPDNDVTVSDWAEKDLAAMLVEARAPAPKLPLLFAGHSLGGQLIGVTPGNDAVRASLHITAGSGYYKFNDRMPLRVRALWFVFMPLLTPLFGYFPGKRLRMVGDLPRGVANQWRRWCLHPDYLLSEGEGARAAYARFSAPIFSYSFEDDDINTRPGIDKLHSFYTAAHVVRRHVHPRDAGLERIGHFGFFAEKCRETLWRDALAWLRSQASPSTQSTVIRGTAQAAT